MKVFFMTCLGVIVFNLSGCATTRNLSSTELNQVFQKSNVSVSPVDKPAKLTERTKAQAVGNMVVSSIVGSVAGSGGAANAQQFQNNMQLAQNFTQQLNNSLPASYKIESGAGADLLLAKKISDFFMQKAKLKSDTGENIYIAVGAPLWELAYISMLMSQDYALNYNLQIRVSEKKNGAEEVLKIVNCVSTSKDNMPLEQWQTNDYAAVNKTAEAIVTGCFNQFVQEVGL